MTIARRALIRWPASALVLAVPIGCSDEQPEDTPKLDALRRDPMATITIPNVKQTRLSERDEHVSMGKPISAHIIREMTIAAGDVDHVLRSIRALAREHGWQPEKVRGNGFLGRKTLSLNLPHPPPQAVLGVHFQPDLTGAIILTQG